MSTYSLQRYTSDGSNRNFNVPFQYLSKPHIEVRLDGVITQAYTWLNDSTIQLNSAAASGVVVELRRNTPKETRLVNFQDASVLTEKDLDVDSEQCFFVAQEAIDQAVLALYVGSDNKIDAEGSSIKNLPEPTSDDEVANKQYVDSVALGVLPLPLSVANGGTGATDAQGILDLIGLSDPALVDTALQPAAIGTTVQAYDADTAKLDVAQNFTLPQRSALLTANSGTFDLSAKQNFKCTAAGAVTLLFTNRSDGLSGSVIFINGGNHAIAAHANTKITAADLTKIQATGTYRIDYISDGTNAYCSVVGGY